MWIKTAPPHCDFYRSCIPHNQCGEWSLWQTLKRPKLAATNVNTIQLQTYSVLLETEDAFRQGCQTTTKDKVDHRTTIFGRGRSK